MKEAKERTADRTLLVKGAERGGAHDFADSVRNEADLSFRLCHRNAKSSVGDCWRCNYREEGRNSEEGGRIHL